MNGNNTFDNGNRDLHRIGGTMREEVLDKAKKILAENMEDYRCGLFNTRNTVGDTMRTIYQDKDITIECCDSWAYYEVFGLTKEEFGTLHEWYEQNKYRSTRQDVRGVGGMANQDKDIEITNIKSYLTHEYDFLIIGGCTDKQRQVADVLRETIDRIAEIQRQ